MLRFSDRLFAFFLFCGMLTFAAPGCTSPLFRGQSPEAEEFDELVDLVESSDPPEAARLVGDLTAPLGINWLKVEGAALVTQLGGTGSDPPPTPLRDRLIKEIQTHDVKSYSRALASPDTALVVVKGYIPPAAEKGDSFDIEVTIPARSRTSSLRGGWLMRSRLRELRYLDILREGHVEALASGAILVDALFDASEQSVAETRGRVPGGAILRRSRHMGLAIRDEHASVQTSAMIGAAINERFHHFDRGVKKGVANPKRDDLIELAMYQKYKHNVGRYLRVIRNIAVGESPGDRTRRLALLPNMLLEPTTAQTAALQLEAIGHEGAGILRDGLNSRDPEVQFYAAEALAYLGDTDATQVLYQAARQERAFRWRALGALATLDSFEAQEALAQLMNEPSAETRYGAFRALRARDKYDPLVVGTHFNDEFFYHVTGSGGEPMVHFSHTNRPEIAVFGSAQRLRPPTFLYAGESILIKGIDQDTLKVTSFRSDREDRSEVCSTELNDVVRAIAKMGGGYTDVFTALTTAKARGYLDCRIEVDALPGANRRYERSDRVAEAPDEAPRFGVRNPIPEMFFDRLSRRDAERDSGETEAISDQGDDQRTKKGVFARMGSWLPGRSE